MDNDGQLSVEVLHYFLRHTEHLSNVIPLPVDSMRAYRFLQNAGVILDMVFIDASHVYEDVILDIQRWQRLLMPSGFLCGHDYGEPAHPGVKQAVDELVPKFRVVPGTRIWTTEV